MKILTKERCKVCRETVSAYYTLGGVCPVCICTRCISKYQADTEEPCEVCGSTTNDVYLIDGELVCECCLERYKTE